MWKLAFKNGLFKVYWATAWASSFLHPCLWITYERELKLSHLQMLHSRYWCNGTSYDCVKGHRDTATQNVIRKVVPELNNRRIMVSETKGSVQYLLSNNVLHWQRTTILSQNTQTWFSIWCQEFIHHWALPYQALETWEMVPISWCPWPSRDTNTLEDD